MSNMKREFEEKIYNAIFEGRNNFNFEDFTEPRIDDKPYKSGFRYLFITGKKSEETTMNESTYDAYWTADDEFRFEIYAVQDELADVIIKKHQDYGPKNISNSPGGPLNGINVRLYDKIARLSNLIDNNIEPNNESLRDTLVDISNYALIGLLVIDGKWDK